jgi:DNA-binding MarR family transcriptional regulator
MTRVDWKKISRFEDSNESPGLLLWQVSAEWRRRMERVLMPLGLTHPQFVLLACIGWLTKEGKEVSQVMLARHCNMDITMTSQVLRTLEKKELIERRGSLEDSRAKNPWLTPSGGQILEKALPAVEKTDTDFFGKHGQLFLDAMNKIKKGFSDPRKN